MGWINGGILREVDKIIFEELGLDESKAPPHYQRLEACQEISDRSALQINGRALIQKVYEKITSNWHGSKSRGKENWRWKQNTKSTKEKENKSKEVILERLIVLTAGQKWVNQVPTASGLTKVIKPRESFDRRRAVDLVCQCGDERYELIELKVDQKAGSPLFAAMEILQYGLLYVFYRDNLQDLEPEKLKPETDSLLGATSIDLKVLAPDSYYKNRKGEDYKLESLEGIINEGLKAFLADQKFIFKMHFEFQKFPRDFNLDSIIRERKSPDPRIEDALRRRMSVCSEPL